MVSSSARDVADVRSPARRATRSATPAHSGIAPRPAGRSRRGLRRYRPRRHASSGTRTSVSSTEASPRQAQQILLAIQQVGVQSAVGSSRTSGPARRGRKRRLRIPHRESPPEARAAIGAPELPEPPPPSSHDGPDRRCLRDGAQPRQRGQSPRTCPPEARGGSGASARTPWCRPARSAPIRTSGVRLRKSPAVLDMLLSKPLVRVALPRPVAGVRHRDRAVGDLPAVEPLAQRLVHGLLDRLEERQRHRPELDLAAGTRTPGVDRRRLDAQPDRREERVGRLVDDLDRRAGADRPLDADRRRLAERRRRCRSRSPASPG